MVSMKTPTLLSLAVRAKRGNRFLRDAAAESGMAIATLSRLERAQTGPGTSLARLASWLGWDVARVRAAHLTPVQPPAERAAAFGVSVTQEEDGWRAEVAGRVGRGVVVEGALVELLGVLIGEAAP